MESISSYLGLKIRLDDTPRRNIARPLYKNISFFLKKQVFHDRMYIQLMQMQMQMQIQMQMQMQMCKSNDIFH
jgi:hypothetical protein